MFLNEEMAINHENKLLFEWWFNLIICDISSYTFNSPEYVTKEIVYNFLLNWNVSIKNTDLINQMRLEYNKENKE